MPLRTKDVVKSKHDRENVKCSLVQTVCGFPGRHKSVADNILYWWLECSWSCKCSAVLFSCSRMWIIQNVSRRFVCEHQSCLCDVDCFIAFLSFSLLSLCGYYFTPDSQQPTASKTKTIRQTLHSAVQHKKNETKTVYNIELNTLTNTQKRITADQLVNKTISSPTEKTDYDENYINNGRKAS